MISRDYTKEVGVSSQKKTLPRPVAILVLLLVGVGIWFGVAGVVAKAKEHEAAEKASATPSAPATTAPVVAPDAPPVKK
jgi:hypothetical protein